MQFGPGGIIPPAHWYTVKRPGFRGLFTRVSIPFGRGYPSNVGPDLSPYPALEWRSATAKESWQRKIKFAICKLTTPAILIAPSHFPLRYLLPSAITILYT